VEKATISRAREAREKTQKPPGKLEEEIQAEEAEAALEVERTRRTAQERKRKADAELLELEAMDDPKKILPYVKTLDPDITAPFFDVCEKAGITPRKGLGETVKLLG